MYYKSSIRGDIQVAQITRGSRILTNTRDAEVAPPQRRPVYKFYMRRRRGCTSSKFKSLPSLDKYFLPHSHAHSAHWYLIFG